jgi:hypothetical protein
VACSPENPEALARAIARAAAHPRLREAFAAAGRRTYERHFRLETFTERFAELIARAADRRSPSARATDGTYASWVAQFDELSIEGRTALRARLRALRRRPLISIVMPVFNPEVRFPARGDRLGQAATLRKLGALHR